MENIVNKRDCKIIGDDGHLGVDHSLGQSKVFDEVLRRGNTALALKQSGGRNK